MNRAIRDAGVSLAVLCALLTPRLTLAEETGTAVCDAAPPLLPSPAPIEPAPQEPKDYRTARDFGGWQDAPLGVGHLKPKSPDYLFWPSGAVVPIYGAPGGRHLGWVESGWVTTGGTRVPLSWAGLVETGYEQLTMVVWEARDDGWLKVRVAAPTAADDGTVWTHICRLGQGSSDFDLVLWRDFFSSAVAPSLSFRKAVPHALRAGPFADSEWLRWVVEHDEVEVLEIRGDWMRVRAFHPGKFYWMCAGKGEWQGSSATGWVRWWSPEKGPWLWWPTRGC